MALSHVAVMEKMRTALETIETDYPAEGDTLLAYAPSKSNVEAGGVPSAIQEFPAALILPDRQDGDYILQPGQHRHSYRIRVLLLFASADYTEAMYITAPLLELVIEKMVANVTVGNTANSVLMKDWTFGQIPWAGKDYIGYEISFRVSEQASATPATGS